MVKRNPLPTQHLKLSNVQKQCVGYFTFVIDYSFSSLHLVVLQCGFMGHASLRKRHWNTGTAIHEYTLTQQMLRIDDPLGRGLQSWYSEKASHIQAKCEILQIVVLTVAVFPRQRIMVYVPVLQRHP